MSTSRLIRWGGVALFIGSVLWGLQKIGWQLFIGQLDPRAYPQPTATILWGMGLLAAVLVLLGLPALYARQAKQAGRTGLVAFAVVFSGMALVTANAYYGVFLQAGLVDLILMAEEAGMTVQEPVAAAVGFVISLLLYLLGFLFFGLISLRAGVLPRWALVLVMAGIGLGLFGSATGGILALPVTEVGLAWLGWALWQESNAIAAQTRPVSEAG
jgi:hypothetical protein